ncbi:MAG: FtsX-like permease family protein [Lachnospiraceae bacterium]|nr:FtsX-like permease family protein [Lachnospiraceae bacterium]
MFLRILKKDLKRKRTMNIILLLFIILASMFLASSVDNLIAVNGAIDHFMEISKVPDFLVVALTDGVTDEIADFLEENKWVSEYEVIDGFNLINEDVTITSCQTDPERDGYERTNTLFIGKIPENFIKVFTEENEVLTLKAGQIAFPKLEADNNDLQVGDTVSIRVGEEEQEFEIAAIVKDAVFGSSMMGFKRLFIGEEDFARYERQEGIVHTRVYNVNYADEEKFRKEWKEQSFNVISAIDGQSTIRMCYIMDMLIAAILIVVSVCLILLAFLVLRFTIVFTLQEDYKEIGIMKAIGMRDRGIKGLYLVKYSALAVVGALIGLLFSVPFGKAILDRAIVNIVVEQTEQNFVINIVCAVVIVGIVLLFCSASANKLKKISALQAIRNGSDGERYRAKSHLKLWRQPGMRPCFYMALNDILSSLRRFGVLFVTFCLGMMLILLPLSAANTLKSDGIISEFSLSPSDVYLDTGKGETYTTDIDSLFCEMEEIEDILRENGMKAATGADMGYMIPCYADDPEDSVTYYVLQALGNWDRHYSVLSGREPELANEVMITEITAKELGVEIGDTIHFKMSDRTEEFIITGTYQSMMNMGQGYRVSRNAEMDPLYAAGIMCIQVEIEGMESEEACEKLQSIFPDYRVMDAKGSLDSMIGGIIEQIDTMTYFIVGIVLVINSLITILMMKTIMTKERGDIALLKSIGFANGSLRAWQTARILMILVASVVAGTLLSNLFAPYIIGPIFAMMGATSIKLVMGTVEVYVVYPLLLLAVTGVTALLCAGGVKNVDLKEVNDIE